VVRDQRRHSLRERAIIGSQLERADLQTFVDDRHGDRFALLTDGEPSIETVSNRGLYPGERNPSCAKGFQHPSQNVFGVAAAVEDPLDRLERPAMVDCVADHAAAISQSPSSNPRIASRYQPGIVRARRCARSTRTSV